MIYGLYLSAAGLQANSFQMDTMANNLANANTVGFKHEIAVFSERRVESEGRGPMGARHALLDNLSGGTFVPRTYTTFAQGPLEATHRPLDLAIRGEGFFQVREGGRDFYTRDGRLTVDSRGQLMTTSGKAVMSTDQAPLFVDTGSSEAISVGPDGTVRQGSSEIGRLNLVEFADPQSLTKVGGGLYEANGQAALQATGEIASGHVELSTVDPVAGLARMVEISRAYQSNANLISMQDEMLGRAVNDLGRVG